MARVHIAAALATACFGLLVAFHLIAQFGLPNVGFFHFEQNRDAVAAAPNQIPFGPANSQKATSNDEAAYLLGTGKADITGPVVEINLMGYADPNQVGTGLRQRLYSRAFIVGEIDKPEERIVYLVLDTQSGDTAVRHGILEGLKELGPAYAIYGKNNVAVTGTHSHSGPGAWLNYLLPQITSKGFDEQSYRAIVDGALLSVSRAHESLAPGYLSVADTKVHDANVNRSPYAYLANPEKERARYEHDVDKTMTMLKFMGEDGKAKGVLTWFPVHGTSMLGNNTLISGDNKGVAAALFEKDMQGFEDDFVAGFSQANVGDTSPNVLGAYCENGSGDKCNFEDSTCGGRSEQCHGRGPFFRENDQGASSCFEIGRRQYAGAKGLYDSMATKDTALIGPVRSLHTYRDLSSFTLQHPNGSLVNTCPAALGYSFAAGTTDGPGAFDFKQNNTGSPNANPVWSVVRNFLREPSEDQKACHAPKPILLDVGEIERPYLWTPNIVDIQLLRIGQLLIIVSPGEATTMAGRRWKEAIAISASALSLTSAEDIHGKDEDPIVVLGGPANSYTHYIATEEEYGIQRYEGASTLYGPHTLNAYINLTTSLLPYLHSASSHTENPPPGPQPPIHTNISYNFNRKVRFDRTPFFKKFGQVLKDVNPAYRTGEKVQAKFVGANPRNDLRLEGNFAAVEHLTHGEWRRVRDDSDWDLIFHWRRTNTVLGTSEVVVEWEVGKEGVERGLYRLRYFGDRKEFGTGDIGPFEGVSGVFRVE
ncbi:MAG: hypothetical protein Q9218_000241 [Villophora microphyllina]